MTRLVSAVISSPSSAIAIAAALATSMGRLWHGVYVDYHDRQVYSIYSTKGSEFQTSYSNGIEYEVRLGSRSEDYDERLAGFQVLNGSIGSQEAVSGSPARLFEAGLDRLDCPGPFRRTKGLVIRRLTYYRQLNQRSNCERTLVFNSKRLIFEQYERNDIPHTKLGSITDP